jgi:hypothetical protein
MAALLAPLADTMLVVPLARAGAANDPHHLYTSMPEGQLPLHLCIFTASLSLFVYMLLRLGTHYLCRSSEGLDNGLELEVIDEEEEMGDSEAGETKDDGSKVG